MKTEASLLVLLRALRLPSFGQHYEEVASKAAREGWTHAQFLHQLCELEISERSTRRIDRLRKSSGLPPEKTLHTLDRTLLSAKSLTQLATLSTGAFLKNHENVLAFGLPGRGKTHLLCALGHTLIDQGYAVSFIAAHRLVQQLLVAKRDLRLEKELSQWESEDVVIVDDIGYVQQNREEMEVLFTFFAERYERKSVMISSNLVFSQWDKIFKDPMTTAAAIDRLIHHATIIEMTGPSIRTEKALSTEKEGTAKAKQASL